MTQEPPSAPQAASTSDAQRIAYNTNYRNALDSIQKAAMDEFNGITYTLKNFQYSTIKTYLWISTVVFAAELAFYADIASSSGSNLTAFIHLNVDIQTNIFKAFSVVSLLLSLGVFVLGVDTMRGRGATYRPCSSWEKLADMAFQDCDENYKSSHHIELIHGINVAIAHHLEASSKIGVKLRIMSWGILASVTFAILTLLT